MADDAQQSDPGEKAPMVDVAQTADRLRDIASQSLDANEVARQIEELTSVVLDSAEVSTRSASVAADISATMRAVVLKIQSTNKRNILHSRVVLGVFVACLLVAIGIFLGISLKMTRSIKELDTMIYAMAKRVIEVDASLTAISKTNSDFSELTDKQDALTLTQTQVASRLEELSKAMNALPSSVADQSIKSSDAKFQAMQKQLQSLEAKLQSMEGKLQSASQASSRQVAPVAPAGPSTQTLLNEIQKLKQDLNTSTQSHDKAIAAAERAASRAAEKAAAATSAADKAVASERAAAAERAALQKAAAERAAADKAAAERAAAEKAAAEKVKAATAAAPPKDRPIQYPRAAD